MLAGRAVNSVIQSHVEEMLEKGIVEVSHSPWAAPVVMVKKKMAPGASVSITEA